MGDRWVALAPLEEVSAWDAGSWRERVRSTRTGQGAGLPVPAWGWWGWFGYEAGGWMDRAPAPAPAPVIDGDPFALPTTWLGRARGAAILDRRTGEWTVAGDPDRVALLTEALATPGPLAPPAPASAVKVGETPGAVYREAVRRALQHLRAGDCYQVNLARRLDFVGVGDPFAAWRRLRTLNPARRGMYVETPHGAVLSNSPELLLSVTPDAASPSGWAARSHPIKGTAPRAALGPEERRSAARALVRSPKERAELTMIVDLVRADLGRVAAPGSVVAGRRRVGPMGHLWHAAQRVGCQLAAGRDAVDAFAAIFPAGSVTGAPKLRAMEVIRALEEGPRGVYCGAVGWFGDDGRARWNVAIRTISVVGSRASFHVGAGIVMGSDPAREEEETRHKGERLARALAGEAA